MASKNTRTTRRRTSSKRGKGQRRPPPSATQASSKKKTFADLEELLEEQHPEGGLTHTASLQISHDKGDYPYPRKISTKAYEQEKLRLQAELLKVQNWAKEAMFFYTDTADARWTIIKSDDKKRARLECMRHFLFDLDYPDKNKDIVQTPDPKLVLSPSEIFENGGQPLGEMTP